QLCNAQGCQNVGQIHLVSCIHNFVIPGAFLRIPVPCIAADSMKTHCRCPIGQSWIVGCQHASFRCCDCLRGIEAERRKLGNSPNAQSAIPCRQGVCCVFNH